MDELFGPGSFLGGILGFANKGAGAATGADGAQPGWGNIGGTGGNVPQAGPQGGMPAPTGGIAPPMNINPQVAGNPQGPTNPLQAIASKLGLWGGGNQGQAGGQPGQPTFGQKAASLGQQYLNKSQQPLKPATFQPMQLQGPIPGPQNIV